MKSTDPYSMVTDETTQSLDSHSDYVIGTIEGSTPQKLSNVNGFSVFMHVNYRILSKKHPNISSRKVFSKVATIWRNSEQQNRVHYRKLALRIRDRYLYAISGEVDFNSLYEEVLSTTKTSGSIMEKELALLDELHHDFEFYKET